MVQIVFELGDSTNLARITYDTTIPNKKKAIMDPAVRTMIKLRMPLCGLVHTGWGPDGTYARHLFRSWLQPSGLFDDSNDEDARAACLACVQDTVREFSSEWRRSGWWTNLKVSGNYVFCTLCAEKQVEDATSRGDVADVNPVYAGWMIEQARKGLHGNFVDYEQPCEMLCYKHCKDMVVNSIDGNGFDDEEVGELLAVVQAEIAKREQS
jgi:hypothetical protein